MACAGISIAVADWAVWMFAMAWAPVSKVAPKIMAAESLFSFMFMWLSS